MKKFKILSIIFISSLFCVSCLVDDEDPTLEALTNTPYVVGFRTNSALESYFSDIGAIPESFEVNVLSGQSGVPPTSDLVVNYAVNPASTATEGVEFDFADSSGNFTIPANTTFGFVDMLINTCCFNADMPTQLILDLVSVEGDAGYVSALNKSLTITFVGCQSNNAGNYTNPDLPSGANDMATITELDVNSYECSGLPGIGFGGIDPVKFYFTNVCGDIQINSWEVATLATGAGTEDPTTGDITFTNILLYNGSTVATGVWFDLGTTTYTKN